MEQSISKITKYLLIILAIIVPLRDLISYYTISYMKFLPDIMIYILLLFVLIKNKFKLNLKIYDKLYIVFLIIGFISTLINKTSILAYALQFRSITTMYILFYILRTLKLDKEIYKPALKTLIITTSIIGICAIGEYLTNKCLMFPENWALSIKYATNYARTYSLVNNPNTFSVLMFMTMLLAYYCEKEEHLKIPKAYYLLVFISIILGASRSTMLVLLIFLIFVFLNSRKEHNYKNFINFIIIGLISIGLFFSLSTIKSMMHYSCAIQDKNEYSKEEINNSTANRWEETLSGDTLKNSMSNGRVYNIKKGLEIFMDYPIIGTGFGTFGSAASRMVTPKLYEKYDLYEGFYSDNDYIKIFVETGILGTIFFIAFVLTLLYSFKDNKYKVLMYLSYLLIGMFYNVSEMQIMCYILYLSLIYFTPNEKRKRLKK